MVQRRWSPPRQGMVYGSYPPPPCGGGRGLTYLLFTYTYLVSYLLTLTPRSPCGGGRVLTYLVTYLLSYLTTYLLAYLLTY